MRITRSQVRQIIREELSRLQESRRDDDEADDMEFYSGEEGGEEGSGYEYLSRMPGTIEWIDGPVDKAWLSSKMRRYGSFPHGLRREIARDFEKMLMGMRVDPDIVSNYRNPDGTSNVTRQTVEALVDMLHSGR